MYIAPIVTLIPHDIVAFMFFHYPNVTLNPKPHPEQEFENMYPAAGEAGSKRTASQWVSVQTHNTMGPLNQGSGFDMGPCTRV